MYGSFKLKYRPEQRHKHSSCADEPFVTPPPGFDADAKLRTATFLPLYAAAALKVLFFETITLASFAYLFRDCTPTFSVSKITFYILVEAATVSFKIGFFFTRFSVSLKISMFVSLPISSNSILPFINSSELRHIFLSISIY